MFTDDQLKQMRQVMREEVKPLDERLGGVEKRLTGMETTVNQIKSTQEAVTAGGQTLATKADVQDIMAELKNHKRRIENLEEETGTANPYKH